MIPMDTEIQHEFHIALPKEHKGDILLFFEEYIQLRGPVTFEEQVTVTVRAECVWEEYGDVPQLQVEWLDNEKEPPIPHIEEQIQTRNARIKDLVSRYTKWGKTHFNKPDWLEENVLGTYEAYDWKHIEEILWVPFEMLKPYGGCIRSHEHQWSMLLELIQIHTN